MQQVFGVEYRPKDFTFTAKNKLRLIPFSEVGRTFVKVQYISSYLRLARPIFITAVKPRMGVLLPYLARPNKVTPCCVSSTCITCLH